MSGLRRHFMMGLVLLLCALTDHCGESAPSAAPPPPPPHRDAQRDMRRLVQVFKHLEDSRGPIVKHVEDRRGLIGGQLEDSRGRLSARTDPPVTVRPRSAEQEPRNPKTERGAQAAFPSDLRKKEKFIKYMTGPLYFSPKCRKNVYRLYHHTRDCTIPAYFKRCARLLTRLAGSPQCTEG